MRLLKNLSVGGLLATLTSGTSASSGGYMCPSMPCSADVTALEFAFSVQNFLYQFYKQNGDYSGSEFSSFPNASMIAMNGQTLAENIASNMNGLQRQAMLGVEGIKNLAMDIDLANIGYSTPNCSYTFPPSLNEGGGMQFVVTAYYIEATLCGTFIGLADYVQTPESALLMARLSAEHGIHASFLASYMKATPFSANSTALTPAFNPQEVLTSGSGEPSMANVGHLGKYVPSSCAPVPQAPCGGNVQIGNITALLVGGNATTTASATGTNGMNVSATSTGIAVATYTGTAATGGLSLRTVVGLVGGAVFALL